MQMGVDHSCSDGVRTPGLHLQNAKTNDTQLKVKRAQGGASRTIHFKHSLIDTLDHRVDRQCGYKLSQCPVDF